MRWILASKLISALSILVQVIIFGLLIKPSSVQAAYSALAVISLVSQIAIALPNLISSQSSWLEPNQKSSQFKNSVFLAVILLVVGGIIAALSNNTLGGYSGFILIAALPCLASSANVFAASRFASGNFETGAQYNILNVLLPQAVAGIGALISKDIVTWFVGLLLGHSIALFLISLHWSRTSFENDTDIAGSRGPLKIDPAIVITTFIFFLFSWSVLNAPRIFLGRSDQGLETVQLLLVATLGFSFSNAIETLVIQIRRSQWLSFLETQTSIRFTKNLDTEKMAVVFIFGVAAMPGSIFAYLCIYLMQKDTKVLAGFFTVFCILMVESCRGAISTIYAINECERRQQKLLPLFAVFIGVYVLTFSNLALTDPSLSYEMAAAIMLIGTVILAIKTTNFKSAFRFRD